MNSQWKETLLVLFISLLGMILLFLQTNRMTYSHPDFVLQGDHHVYLEMATNNPLDTPIPPYGWRILNPGLAKLLPFDLAANFTILSFFSLWLTAIITYFMLRRVGFSNNLSIIGLLFFLSLGWATRFNIYDFWLTDPMGFLFITAILWSVFAKNDLLFAILLTVGVTAKEGVIFVAPLYYTLTSQKFLDIKNLFRTVYLVAPSLLILFLLRVFIPANGGYNVVDLFWQIGLPRLQSLHFDRSFIYNTGTFGVSLMILPLFALKQNFTLLWKFSPFIVLTYLSLLFANNTQRLIVSFFPVVIIMALYGIKSISNLVGVHEKSFIPLPLILLVILLINKDWFTVDEFYESLILLIYLALILQSKTLTEKLTPLLKGLFETTDRYWNSAKSRNITELCAAEITALLVIGVGFWVATESYFAWYSRSLGIVSVLFFGFASVVIGYLIKIKINK